MWLELRIGMR